MRKDSRALQKIGVIGIEVEVDRQPESLRAIDVDQPDRERLKLNKPASAVMLGRESGETKVIGERLGANPDCDYSFGWISIDNARLR